MTITRDKWETAVLPADTIPTTVDELEYKIFRCRQVLKASTDSDLLEHYGRELDQARVALAALYRFNAKG